MTDRLASDSAAVIIPAASCPCDQVERIFPQLSDRDQLIVVHNGTTGRGNHDCGKTLPADPRCVHVHCDRLLGPARARNLGVSSADEQNGIYAFADADDRVTTRWLYELRRPLAAALADVAGGGLVTHDAVRDEPVLPGRDYWHEQAMFGGNLALTAPAWMKLGGFDPTFRYCEDTELAWRATAAGLRVQVVPSALVEVSTRALAREALQRYRWGRASIQLLNQHGLPLADHLPTLRQLVTHKRAGGYCHYPFTTAAAQWLGQITGAYELGAPCWVGSHSRCRQRF